MKKLYALPAIVITSLLTACSEPEHVKNAENGEFFLDSIYMDSVEANSTHSMIHEIEWTGEEPVTINSFDLVKENNEPVTFNEDGIDYEVYGADPLKKVGVYSEGHDIGAVEDISGYEIDETGRIVLVLQLGEVSEELHRAARINYTVNGEEQEVIYDWDGYKQFSTGGS